MANDCTCAATLTQDNAQASNWYTMIPHQSSPSAYGDCKAFLMLQMPGRGCPLLQLEAGKADVLQMCRECR